jgi:hypothetical protein
MKFKFMRGKYSAPDEYVKLAVDVICSNGVTYLYDNDGQKIGWIPAKENFLGLMGAKLGVTYRGVIISNEEIEVYPEVGSSFTTDPFINDIKKYGTANINTGTVASRYLNGTLIDNTKQPSIADKNWSQFPVERQSGMKATFNTNFGKQQTMLENLIETNKQAAKQAAYLEAGRLANVTLEGILIRKFPSLPQTPFNQLIMANIMDQVAKNFKPNAQLAKVTAAMTTQAYLELYQMVDLEGMIAEFMNDAVVKNWTDE